MPGTVDPAGADGAIQVLRGNPADDELAAAVVAVLAALAAARGGGEAAHACGRARGAGRRRRTR
ncbi:acyl-CoA carboxylase epsilon subunit [Streptomyces sp. M19]